ncbi:MAG TPA: PHP domain-containing protein [Acidimicrobiia bacterium]|nr:PHP domain-containing protein [Acidimicrobiia bacterium]
MAVDLHSHSTASDGSEKPAALVEQALEVGLKALALTDHDTQDGIFDARAAVGGADLELIPGTELSLEYDEGGMHLVVLWLEPGPGPLQDRLEELRHGREQRNELMAQRLTELGMPVTADEILLEGGPGSIGRPHIAAVMMRKGYVETIEEAFELWLTSGRPAYIGRPRLTPEDAIQLARRSGGVPILAHPHTLGINRADEMTDLLTRLIPAGLVGLEAFCAGYRRHEREGYADLARRFGLVPAGGSDFHGAYKPGLSLGTGYGDLVVPDALVDELRTHAGVT